MIRVDVGPLKVEVDMKSDLRYGIEVDPEITPWSL